jgi:hypothetical protein
VRWLKDVFSHLISFDILGRHPLNRANHLLLVLLLIILLTGYVAHAEEAMFDQTGETKMSDKNIEEVFKRHIDSLMTIKGVVGAGQGICDGNPCIKVFVTKKTKELEEKIPGELDGYKVKIEVTGPVRAYPAQE